MEKENVGSYKMTKEILREMIIELLPKTDDVRALEFVFQYLSYHVGKTKQGKEGKS